VSLSWVLISGPNLQIFLRKDKDPRRRPEIKTGEGRDAGRVWRKPGPPCFFVRRLRRLTQIESVREEGFRVRGSGFRVQIVVAIVVEWIIVAIVVAIVVDKDQDKDQDKDYDNDGRTTMIVTMIMTTMGERQ